MIVKVTEYELLEEKNKIWLDEDDMELQINFLEKKEDIYFLNCRAIVDGEAYNNFEVEVALVADEEITSISQFMDLEWDWYDFLI